MKPRVFDYAYVLGSTRVEDTPALRESFLQQAREMVGKPRARGRSLEELAVDMRYTVLEHALVQRGGETFVRNEVGPSFAPWDALDEKTGATFDCKLMNEHLSIKREYSSYLLDHADQIDFIVGGSFKKEHGYYDVHLKLVALTSTMRRFNEMNRFFRRGPFDNLLYNVDTACHEGVAISRN